MLQHHLYYNIKLFFCICICIWQDEACPLIKEGCSILMDIQGTTPAKTLIIQFHLHLSANKQWLADFKILYISSSFTNTKLLFMKSISSESTIINFAILWNLCFSIMFCNIHWVNVFFTFDVFFFYQNSIFCFFFYCSTNLFFVFKNKNNCYLCRFYHECTFDLLIRLVG